MSENYDTSSNMDYIAYICGNSAVRTAKDGIYIFTGAAWELIFSTPDIISSLPVAGSSTNDMLFNGAIAKPHSGYEYIYYYNGNKYFRQTNYVNQNGGSLLLGLTKKSNNYYGFTSPVYSSDSYLVIARRKK